jgi:hypothetical protein
MEYQFFIGLLLGSLITFGYVVWTLKRLYHPIIQAQQAALRDYENSRGAFNDKPD